MNDAQPRRRVNAMLPWLFPLALLVLVLVIAFAPGWVLGLIGVVVFGALGYGGVVLYYRRYQEFHNQGDHQWRPGLRSPGRREVTAAPTAY